jgi:hypothetical protein
MKTTSAKVNLPLKTCLAAAAISILLWVQSIALPCRLFYQIDYYRWGIRSYNGTLWFIKSHQYDSSTKKPILCGGPNGLRFGAYDPAGEYEGTFLGFWFGGYREGSRSIAVVDMIGIPYWPIGAISLIYPYVWYKRFRKTQSNLGRFCENCNYDLRAHRPNQKCPECGTPIPPTTPLRE